LSLLGLVLLVLGLTGAEVVPDARAQAAGTPAPAFDLVTLTGEAYSNNSLKGQPALFMFWAPWCPVCRKELPILGEFYKTEKPAKLRVISIGFADNRGNVEEYVKAHPETFVFPTAYDEESWVSRAFKINATPTFVVLDQSGTVILVHRGGGINQNPLYQQFLKSFKG
jgi:thiol-disulfide isomerase/thioredoxin